MKLSHSAALCGTYDVPHTERIVIIAHAFKYGSTRLSSTAFVATMIEDADMRSAEISGRSDQPSEE